MPQLTRRTTLSLLASTSLIFEGVMQNAALGASEDKVPSALTSPSAGSAASAVSASTSSINAAASLNYPSKPITMVVAYAPGGQGDLLARMISEHLDKAYKQPLIVDNRPGVAGTVGTRVAAKAKPDGYTLLLGQTGEIVLNRVLIKDLGYDPMKDLKPVVLVANAPLILLTSASGPIKSVQDLVRLAQASPGALSFASVGAGTPGHLAAAALMLGSKIDMIHIPYKGVGPLMTDLMTGRISVFFSSAGAAIPQLSGGKLKALAVSTTKRMKALPDIPTVAESGLAGFNYSLWGGVFAPADTPAEIIQSLNKEINAVLDLGEVRTKFEADNMSVPRNTPAEFQEFLRLESDKYEKLVKTAHISAD